MAQSSMPPPKKLQVEKLEFSYYHEAGKADSAMLFVLPAQPDAPSAEWGYWRQIASARQWHLVMPVVGAGADVAVRALDALVEEIRKQHALEKAPAFLAGAGAASGLVFYASARAPHIWSAALAVGGTPKPAIDSDRLFGANTLNLELAWAISKEEKAATDSLRHRLQAGGYNLTVLESPTIEQALSWLAGHAYEPFPNKIDCETGNPALGRCYWIKAIEFDPALRNDAVPSTRINPDLHASLDLGGFGYQLSAKGPGVLVEWLPEKYEGPLKRNDRIVALSGTPLSDARHYVELMSQVRDERPVAITVERDKERFRLTTRYQLPKRQEVITMRIQAHYSAQAKEVVIVSRTVATIELTIPPHWIPVRVNWNGAQVAEAQNPGCVVLSIKAPGAARPCRSQ
jgi:hypothetical protein